MDYLSLLLKFVLGGAIVAGTTALAEQIDPKYGGILATAPIITTLSIWYVYVEANAPTAQQLAANSFYFIIPTALFLAFLSFSMNRYSFAISLAGGYGTWLASTLIIYRALGILSW